MGLSLAVGCVMSILVSLCICQCYAQSKVFNIMQFGARGDAITDNSKVFFFFNFFSINHKYFNQLIIKFGISFIYSKLDDYKTLG